MCLAALDRSVQFRTYEGLYSSSWGLQSYQEVGLGLSRQTVPPSGHCLHLALEMSGS